MYLEHREIKATCVLYDEKLKQIRFNSWGKINTNKTYTGRSNQEVVEHGIKLRKESNRNENVFNWVLRDIQR